MSIIFTDMNHVVELGADQDTPNKANLRVGLHQKFIIKHLWVLDPNWFKAEERRVLQKEIEQATKLYIRKWKRDDDDADTGYLKIMEVPMIALCEKTKLDLPILLDYKHRLEFATITGTNLPRILIYGFLNTPFA